MDSEPIICYDKLVDDEDYLLIEGLKQMVVVINNKLSLAEQNRILCEVFRRFRLNFD